MLWQVRALLPDRPGAMAALATRCGALEANILALDVHPVLVDEVVDELVLHTPDGWTKADVKALCAEAGVYDSEVTECSAKALEDQPVRYLRAAQALVREPDRLEELLCRLLDADPSSPADAATLVIDDEAGPVVSLRREHPFTATEQARAAELRLVAAAALEGTGRPVQGDEVAPADRPGGDLLTETAPTRVGALRRGTVVDVGPLIEMHDRCSAETLARRYHSPMRRLSPRLARAMLLPADGFSLVLPDESGESLLAMGMVSLREGVAEVALLVEDRWQGRGHGTELLRQLAGEAVRAGATEMTLITRREDTAVLATAHRAGFRAHVRCVDGVNQLRVELQKPRRGAADRPARRRVTEPLVALLHERKELREVYAPADIIDQAIRDGV